MKRSPHRMPSHVHTWSVLWGSSFWSAAYKAQIASAAASL